jgi:hypothetical protein
MIKNAFSVLRYAICYGKKMFINAFVKSDHIIDCEVTCYVQIEYSVQSGIQHIWYKKQRLIQYLTSAIEYTNGKYFEMIRNICGTSKQLISCNHFKQYYTSNFSYFKHVNICFMSKWKAGNMGRRDLTRVFVIELRHSVFKMKTLKQ